MLGKIALIVLAVILSAKNAFATPPVILSSPQDIKVDSEFTINATMSGLTKNAVYRLRIALSKPDGHSYFGSTEGYNGSPSPIDYSKFKNITTDDKGSWSGEIKGKVENSDPNYKDKDLKTFDLKLGRYTENGTSATWSEIVKINLENPNPPPPTPTPKPPPATKKTDTPVQKTQSPNQSSPPITPINQISLIAKEDEILPEEETEDYENILSTSTSKINETPNLSNPSLQKPQSKAKYIFFSGGLISFLFSALAFLKKKTDIINK